jgi:hypothetical protein
MLLVLSVDDQNTNDDKKMDQQKKELNQMTKIIGNLLFYLHTSI